MHDENPNALSELDALLDEERIALLSGDFGSLQSLVARKEALIDDLTEAAELDADTIAALSKRLVRNQDLLATSLEGIRSVSRRLSQLRQVRGSLDTYDERGQRRSVPLHPDGSLEKRA